VISVESRYNVKAVSKKGASGLMQLMPETAKRYGVADIFDPLQNIRAGAQYLRDLLKMFNNDMRLALAAYNAGENAVVRHGSKIPPYRETTAYVPKVLAFYKQLGSLKLDS
jgi:soluble lytic murein transglycosylase-like protein